MSISSFFARFEDIADVSMGKAGGSVQLSIMSGETIPFHSNRSRPIHSMISSFWKDAAPLGRLPRQAVNKKEIHLSGKFWTGKKALLQFTKHIYYIHIDSLMICEHLKNNY